MSIIESKILIVYHCNLTYMFCVCKLWSYEFQTFRRFEVELLWENIFVSVCFYVLEKEGDRYIFELHIYEIYL